MGEKGAQTLTGRPEGLTVFNSLSWDRREVITLPAAWAICTYRLSGGTAGLTMTMSGPLGAKSSSRCNYHCHAIAGSIFRFINIKAWS